MANQNYLALLRQGINPWNQWRDSNTNLHGVDLSRANLSSAELSGVNLSQVVHSDRF